MRVLIVAEQLRRPVPGGIGTYARGLLAGLHHVDGVDATVYLSRGPAPSDLGWPVLTSRLPGPALTRAWDYGLLDAPRGFDVVHAVSLAAPPSSAPLSVMVHDVAWRTVPDAYPPRGRRWHEAALARARRRAQLLIVPSRDTAKAVHDRRVHVVEEGCDHLPSPDHEAAQVVLDSVGVDGPFVLSLSTLEPRKNLGRLLAAYRQSGLAWPLVVVGPAGWGPDLPPQDNVKLAGFVSEAVKSALLAACRCLVYVPLVEGWGLPATEAMAMGAPVVASPMPSIGEAALVVDPASTDEIAAGIVAAASDEAVRADLVRKGKERAAALTWANAAQAHVDLWRAL